MFIYFNFNDYTGLADECTYILYVGYFVYYKYVICFILRTALRNYNKYFLIKKQNIYLFYL